MNLLLRGTDLVGLPVVTLAGDDIAEVRDVLFDADAGRVVGFTLNKRGRFAGQSCSLEQTITWTPLLPVRRAPTGSVGTTF